jgi:hypothetical protein
LLKAWCKCSAPAQEFVNRTFSGKVIAQRSSPGKNEPARLRNSQAVFCPDPTWNSCFSRFAQPNVERAFATVAHMGILDPDHMVAEFRQAQPERDLPAEHAALARSVSGAFAGNNEHDFGTVCLRTPEEVQECLMGIVLSTAVQINPSID